MATVLIVDDEPNIRRMVGALLTSEGYDVREAPNGVTGVGLAVEQEPDAAMVDLMMPGALDGMAVLARLRERLPELPIIMMSGRAGLADAVQATRLGAFTFLEKPLTPEGVLLALSSALELRQAKLEARALRAEVGLTAEMVGTSEPMRAVREMIARVAPTDARVLITGESGTGKELVAAAIHSGSARRDKPFIRVNCAAIPRDLVESEMFGHERGAFTGAMERRTGRFELAHRGTLLLDEVGDLGAEAQAKLLRAIDSNEIERVGGGKPIRVDVRVISATNKQLDAEVSAGRFRDDLLFRLNVLPLHLPPLRDRREDIPQLVAHFALLHRARTGKPVVRFSEEAVRELIAYSWPGNIRELANIVERLAILHSGGREEVTSSNIRAVLPHAGKHSLDPATAARATSFDLPLADAIDDYERALISNSLADARGNVAEAARKLQTDRPNLYRRMKRLGLDGPSGSVQRMEDE